jgi:predicted nucleic acid-binding protein
VALSDLPLLLLDKSAWVRGPAAVALEAELCLCAITRMEILYSARSASDFELLEEDLAAFRDLRIDTATMDAAVGAQRQAAASGTHRVPIPDLIIAACAERHAADVLHVDRHYELLARYLAFKPIRLAS